jgi:hypothetical protein
VAVPAGEGIPHENLTLMVVDQDGEAMAAACEAPIPVGAVDPRQREAGGRDAVGRVEDGREDDRVHAEIPNEEAEQRRLPVALAETGEELGAGEDASPALADEGGAGEGRRLRREAEEDLLQEVLVFQRRHN